MMGDGGAEAVDLEGGAVDEAEGSEVGEGGEGLAEEDGDLHGAANRRNIRRTLTWGGVEERISRIASYDGHRELWWSIKRCII